jgi:hypothetical protein
MGLLTLTRGDGLSTLGAPLYSPYFTSDCASRLNRFSREVGRHFKSLEDDDADATLQEQEGYTEIAPQPHTDLALGVPTGGVHDDGVRGEHWTLGDGGGGIGEEECDGEDLREERNGYSLGPA